MSEKKELVVQSNRLVEASYRLTLVEQQMILFAICRAREEQLGLSADTLVTITAKDFATMFGTNENTVYRDLKAAMVKLFERHVIINDTHPESGKPRISKVRWVSRASYIDGAGAIQLRFANDMIPFITRLESEFTRYRLEKIGNLSSTYAVRMYELLVQYLSLGKREFVIVDLRSTMGVSEEYPRIVDFKKWVIDVAVSQINAHTDITTSYTQRKTGRNVTHLTFAIKLKAPDKPKKPKIDRAYVEKHALPGESYDAAFSRLKTAQNRPVTSLF